MGVPCPFFLEDPNVANHSINNIIPITVNVINCHQPDFPISWSLLAPTAKLGKNIKTEKIRFTGPFSSAGYPNIIESIIIVIMLAKKLNKQKNQNSDLDALPEKVAYLLKQVFIDVWKFMFDYY